MYCLRNSAFFKNCSCYDFKRVPSTSQYKYPSITETKSKQNQQRPRSWLFCSKQSMSFKAFILYTWKAVQLFFVQEYVAILLLFVRQINWEGKIAVLRIHIPYSKSVLVRFRIERLKEWFNKYLSSRGPNGFAKVL